MQDVFDVVARDPCGWRGKDRRVRALLVDDDEDMRRLVRVLLELEDIEVVGEAEDCKSGARAWAETDPDVVITDHQMPGCDGLELAAFILEQRPDARIVLFSSYLHDAALADADRLGVVAVPKDQYLRLPELVRSTAPGPNRSPMRRRAVGASRMR